MAELKDFIEPREGFVKRRIPSVERRIAEIMAEDMRVSLIGTVIDKQEDSIILDDGTGKITIGFDNPVEIETDQMVRVFGRVIPLEQGFELQGEILQDMNGINTELLKRLRELNSL
ncbi:MAG: replication protein RepA [Candidatus Aenigmarchaeota archaeon]|nr:replication protein RepA [Candidatus Aenigmarchaeota archaeon]